MSSATAAVAILLVLALTIRMWQRSPDIAAIETYSRVDTSLASAECARATGKLLAGCFAGSVVAYRQFSAADDSGIPLLLGIVAIATPVAVDRTTLVRMNLAINFLGTLLLAAWLYRWVGALASACWLVLAGLSIFWKDHPLVADVLGIQAGLIGFSLWAVFCAVTLGLRPVPIPWVRIVLATLALAFVSLLRQPIGMIAAIAMALMLVLCVALNWRKAARAARLAMLLLAALFPLVAAKAGPAVTYAVERIFELPPSAQIAAHGFSHTLYLGLGTEPNPWGIEWDDLVAYEHAKKDNPNIAYASLPYYEALGRMYRQLVLDHPLAVASIYNAKLRKVFDSKLRFASLRATVGALLSLGAVLFVVVAWRFRRNGAPARVPLLAGLGCLLMAAGVVAQSVLGAPGDPYLHPVILPVWCLAALAMAPRTRGASEG
jgi:hypothetical protein